MYADVQWWSDGTFQLASQHIQTAECVPTPIRLGLRTAGVGCGECHAGIRVLQLWAQAVRVASRNHVDPGVEATAVDGSRRDDLLQEAHVWARVDLVEEDVHLKPTPTTAQPRAPRRVGRLVGLGRRAVESNASFC